MIGSESKSHPGMPHFLRSENVRQEQGGLGNPITHLQTAVSRPPTVCPC